MNSLPVIFLVTLVPGLGASTSLNREICDQLPDPTFLEAGGLPITALASFQGSGNTWVRQILARATGYKTGDLYKSNGNDIYPEFSSASNDTVIAVKTHTFATSVSNEYGFKRALLIVRNPLDALYSEFNRMYSRNKTAYAEAKHLINSDGSLSWKWDVWMTHISSWIDFYKYWLEVFPGPAHIIYYNNLKSRPHAELSSAINFLGLQLNVTRVNCTIEFPRPAYFKRPHTQAPIEKQKLFSLAMSKEATAIEILKDLVIAKFGIESELYRTFNLDISVK